jgi:uncharacterized protein YwqG
MTKRDIPPFRLIPEPENEAARALAGFKWAASEVGRRHKLGGSPTFLQEAAWPICASCNQAMTFYGQLDSINDDIILADCGIVYLFVCFDCFETTSFIQSG